jgi:hypothetical protein
VAHKDRLTPSDQHIYMRSADLTFFERDLPILMPEVQCPYRSISYPFFYKIKNQSLAHSPM